MKFDYELSRSNIDALKECLSILENLELRNIAKVIHENLIQISITLAMPHFLITDSVRNVKHFEYLLMGAVETKNKIQPETIEAQNQLNEFIKAKFKENTKQHSEDGRKLLNTIRSKMPYIEGAIRTLALNSLVNTWTIFESASKEIWIYLLNNYQDKFLNDVLESKGVSEVEGISGKLVSISFLGKYGFNINGKLGEILVNKYDFTSCSGIRKAFADFDKTKKDQFEFLNDQFLFQLEILRNLIVHKAGLIDDVYLNRCSIPNQTIGKRVIIDIEAYSNLENAVILAMVSLLKICDQLIKDASHKKN